MVTMIVRPPMSFPPSLSLYLSLFSSETTSHMFANQNRDLSLVATWNNLPKADPLTSLKISFFFNSECSLSMAVSHRVQVAGVMARGWRLHEKNVYHVFFGGHDSYHIDTSCSEWLVWTMMSPVNPMLYVWNTRARRILLQDETSYNSVVKASFRDDVTNLVNIQKTIENGP